MKFTNLESEAVENIKPNTAFSRRIQSFKIKKSTQVIHCRVLSVLLVT